MNGMEISQKNKFSRFCHPILHHNFHYKRHQVQWYYHLSQQSTQDFIELPWLDAYFWYSVRLDRKYLIFQGFGTQ